MYKTENFEHTARVTGYNRDALIAQMKADGYSNLAITERALTVEPGDCEQFQALAVDGIVTAFSVEGSKIGTITELD